jgi:type IV fimbrial biogenesis protein FimT
MPTILPTQPPDSAHHLGFTTPRFIAGLTLVELMVVITLLALALTAAAPSLARGLQTRHLHGAAQEVIAALHMARTAAVARNQAVSASVLRTADGGSCHVVHTGERRDCHCDSQAQAVCNLGSQVLQATWLPASGPVSLEASAASIRFDPRAGTATPAGRVQISTRNGREIHAVVSLTGRVRGCSPGGREGGWAAC